MAGTVEEQQARIDALLNAQPDPTLICDRLMACTERGMEDPVSLSPQEIRQVCYVLRLFFHANEAD